MYTFLGTPGVTPDTLQAQHRSRVAGELRHPGTYLLLPDSSDLVWAEKHPHAGIEGTGHIFRIVESGPVGQTGRCQRRSTCGFHLHSTLAVRWTPPAAAGAADRRARVGLQRSPIEVLGLLDQQCHARAPEAEEEGELLRCVRSVERLTQVVPKVARWDAAQARNVYVADCGADIVDVLMVLSARCSSWLGFVVRACQDGAIDAYALPPSRTGGQRKSSRYVRKSHLISLLRAQATRSWPLGEAITFGVHPPATMHPDEPAQTVRLAVTAMRVAVQRPSASAHGAGTGEPLLVTALRVWEPRSAHAAGRTVPPLEWILLTDREVVDVASAYEVVAQYATRWLVIEEFRQALESGIGTEWLQPKIEERFFGAIALISVVATRLMALNEYVRRVPEHPADAAGLSVTELTVLMRQLPDRQIRTVQDVMVAVGRLGGHMNATGDGMPGWPALWRGVTQMQAMARGWELASSRCPLGERGLQQCSLGER